MWFKCFHFRPHFRNYNDTAVVIVITFLTIVLSRSRCNKCFFWIPLSADCTNRHQYYFIIIIYIIRTRHRNKTLLHVNVSVTATFMVTRQGHTVKKFFFWNYWCLKCINRHQQHRCTPIFTFSLYLDWWKNTPPTERGLGRPRFGTSTTILTIVFQHINFFYTLVWVDGCSLNVWNGFLKLRVTKIYTLLRHGVFLYPVSGDGGLRVKSYDQPRLTLTNNQEHHLYSCDIPTIRSSKFA